MPKIMKSKSSSSIKKSGGKSKSKGIVDTSSGSESDSDSSSGSSSSSSSSDTPVPVKVDGKPTSKAKSTPPSSEVNNKVKENTESSSKVSKAKAEIATTMTTTTTTTTTAVNGIGNGPEVTSYHPEHVAILDKLSTGLKEDVKRGLQLLNTCVNQFAQVRWILVNVETTLDDFYKECPVCKCKSHVPNASTNPGPSSNEQNKNSLSHSHGEQDVKQESPEHNDSDGESKKSDKPSQPLIMPMGRSGLNFSKHTSTYKQKLEKLPVKSPTSSKGKHPQNSAVTNKSESGDIHRSKSSGTAKVGSHPPKYRAGPRSKTRPLEKPLDTPPNESDDGVEDNLPLPPGASMLTMDESQLELFEELLKEGARVNVGLEDISLRLDGRKHVKDWRDFIIHIPEPEELPLTNKVSESSAKIKEEKSDHKADSSDLDEDVALITLKRKNDDENEKSSSKKHKTSSTSHSRSHHSKDKSKQSSQKDSSKDKDKEKDRHRDVGTVRKDRISIDSHTSERERKHSTETSKHRKSTDSEHRSKKTSKTSDHKSKDPKSERSSHDSKRRKVDDSDDKKSVASSTHGSESNKRNTALPAGDTDTAKRAIPVSESVKSTISASSLPNPGESVSRVPDSKTQEPTSSKSQETKTAKPGPASKTKISTVQTKKPVVWDVNLVKNKFNQFKKAKNSTDAAKNETTDSVPVAEVAASKPEVVETTVAPSTETQGEMEPAPPSESSGSGASTSEIVKPLETSVETVEEATTGERDCDNLQINEAEALAPRSDKEGDVQNAMDVDNAKVVEEDGGADTTVQPVTDEPQITSSCQDEPHDDGDADSIEIKPNNFDALLQMLDSEGK